jgi:hypothetical protein
VAQSVSVLSLVATALALLVTRTFALDGQTTITQTSTTVFPITITAAGSYVVTTNIIPTKSTVDAIDVNASRVSINLNGFSIIGPGSGSGVGINGPTHVNISVTNGTVTKMGSRGIVIGHNALVKGVNALKNGSDGIAAGNNSEIDDCGANSNAGAGLVCGNDCLIQDDVASANAVDGMYTGTGGTIIRNTASDNTFYGIHSGSNAGLGKNVMGNNGLGCFDFGTSMGDNVCNGSPL